MRLITRSGVATSQQPDHAGPPPARASAESARERILDAACARIASDGIDDVRIARIAQDAGVSPALVHYHFDTRERLLAEALEHSFERAGDSRIGGAPGTAYPRGVGRNCSDGSTRIRDGVGMSPGRPVPPQFRAPLSILGSECW